MSESFINFIIDYPCTIALAIMLAASGALYSYVGWYIFLIDIPEAIDCWKELKGKLKWI